MTEESLEEALGEAKKAAQDLVRASAQLTRRLLDRAQRAAKDPRGSVERAARSAAKELEAAAREVNEILKKI